MSQSQQILKFLQSGKTITPLQALRLFNTLRLGARCWDLLQAGHNIQSCFITLKSGKRCKMYWLAQ